MPNLLERLTAALAERYAVEREIGRGGMATVFVAEDLRHHRKVAIKVLHPELASAVGPDRFLREIEAVAGLTHPHVLPLHDSGQADGLLFYVMPYVEGESLRQRLDREGQLPVEEAVRITQDVAEALDHAHRHGLVHRDIKPGNILLEEGHAVLTDFGVARALSQAGEEKVTATGMAVGTPAYMSPEQASGGEVDARSDLYALGCVLYEMLAGEPPLAGSTPQMIQARRLSETPTALHTLRDTVPPALDLVIDRALAKFPADRYATASQFGQALRGVLLAPTPAAQVEVQAIEERRRTRRWGSRTLWRVVVPAALGAAVVIAPALWFSSGWLGRRPLQITTSNISHVTNDPGLEFQPAISPDGNEVAYVEGPIGSPRIVVRSTVEVGGGGESHPGGEAGGLHWMPAWTSDGASLRFRACSDPGFGFGSGCGWKEVGKLGGSVRTISVPRPSSRYAWSPDGSRVAFAVGDSIYAYSAGSGEPQLLGVHVVDPWAPHSLAWSPDGRRIAYVNGNNWWRWGANVAPASIWTLDADGGEPVRVTDEEHLNVSPQWLPDSRHLLFVSDRDGPRGVYVVDMGPEGPRESPRRVPGSSYPHSISVSADGRRLAYASFAAKQNIWSIPIPEAGVASISEAIPVTEGNQVIESHTLSPDREWIVFDRDIRGKFDIYKQRLDGGGPQLVSDVTGGAYGPDWSPDGTEIAFYSPTSEGAEVLIVSADGGTPRPLTEFPFSNAPAWSPDGLAVAFGSRGPGGTGPRTIWIVARDSVGMPWSDPVQLTDFACGLPDWAPDGASLVCLARGVGARVSRDGEVLSRYDPSVSGLRLLGLYRFSPDGSRIYFVATEADGSRGLWWFPADGGDPVKVVAFDDPSVTVGATVTVGSESLYLTIAEYESDIWVMDLEW